MRPLWYGDRRDRLKWGALFYLTTKFTLSPIIQVAFWHDETDTALELGNDGEKTLMPRPVWDHFSDLRGIKRLGRATGERIEVIDRPFRNEQRQTYVQDIIARFDQSSRPKLLFLDPDTGIQPDKSAGPQHATLTDVHRFWTALHRHDVLATYQHASRRKGWMRKKENQFSSACDGSHVSSIWSDGIAKDVAVLWARRTRDR